MGRGTNQQFQIYGAPGFPKGDFGFTPVPMPGAKYPKHENQLCRGFDLSRLELDTLFAKKQLDLSYLLNFYQNYPDKSSFFTNPNFFDKLAGTDQLRQQIINGLDEQTIRESWEPALSQFRAMREKYLLYD